MSDPSETNGRPLASTFQQFDNTTQQQQQPPLRRRTTSQSSDERVGGTKSTSSRRRPGPRKELSFGPHTGSSRGDSSTMQRSVSPSQMSPEMQSVNYTRTGRISKAKKGLKVHNCECGRVSHIYSTPLQLSPILLAARLAEHLIVRRLIAACTTRFGAQRPRICSFEFAMSVYSR
jgi:hypothetical protein